MEKKSDNKLGNFFYMIMAIITANRLLQHFDFKNLKFERPWLDALYLLVFIGSILIIIRNYIKQRQSKN